MIYSFFYPFNQLPILYFATSSKSNTWVKGLIIVNYYLCFPLKLKLLAVPTLLFLSSASPNSAGHQNFLPNLVSRWLRRVSGVQRTSLSSSNVETWVLEVTFWKRDYHEKRCVTMSIIRAWHFLWSVANTLKTFQRSHVGCVAFKLSHCEREKQWSC